jgi:hypothetical protein
LARFRYRVINPDKPITPNALTRFGDEGTAYSLDQIYDRFIYAYGHREFELVVLGAKTESASAPADGRVEV